MIHPHPHPHPRPLSLAKERGALFWQWTIRLAIKVMVEDAPEPLARVAEGERVDPLGARPDLRRPRLLAQDLHHKGTL